MFGAVAIRRASRAGAVGPEPPAEPPMTVARPRREPAGMGLRARPSGIGARLRSILGAGIAGDRGHLGRGGGGAHRRRRRRHDHARAGRRRTRAVRRDGGRTGDDARRALATEIRDRLARGRVGQFELGEAPVGHPLRRRQRHGQDDDDREACAPPRSARAAPWRWPRPTRSAPRRSSSCGSGASSSAWPSSRSAPGPIPGPWPSTPSPPRSRATSTPCSSTPPGGSRTSSSSWTSWRRSGG